MLQSADQKAALVIGVPVPPSVPPLSDGRALDDPLLLPARAPQAQENLIDSRVNDADQQDQGDL